MLYTLVIISCLQGGGYCHPSVVSSSVPADAYNAQLDTMLKTYDSEHPDRDLKAIGCLDAERVQKWFERHEA